MPRTRKDYEPYRPALTRAQQKELDEARNDADRREIYKRAALTAAREQLESDECGTKNRWNGDVLADAGALPEDEEICLRFPDVDPRGKYSEIDMKFAHRRQQIQTVLQKRDDRVNGVFAMLFTDERFRDLEQRVDMAARQQRLSTRASKLCHDDEAAAELQTLASACASNPDVQSMELFYTGAEYLLGIRTGALPKDVEKFFREEMRHAIMPEDVERCRTEGAPTSEPVFRVQIPDLETRMIQFQFAQPENWGKPPKQFPSLKGDQVDTMLSLSTETAVNRVLDVLYGEVERKTAPRERYGIPLFNRFDNLIINGRTAREILDEEFEKEEPSIYFTREEQRRMFLADDGKRLVAQAVTAALTQPGQYVEAIVPDEHGNLPTEPIALTQSGFDSAHLTPVTLNAWQRFWSHFGRYKEKVAQAHEYKRRIEARDRARFKDGWAQQNMREERMENGFLGACFTKNPPPDVSWRYKMNGGNELDGVGNKDWASLAMLKLFADGHSIEEITDPTRLLAEKEAAGQAVIALFSGEYDDAVEGPRKQMAQKQMEQKLDLLKKGSEALSREITRYCKDNGIDSADARTYDYAKTVPLGVVCSHAAIACGVIDQASINGGDYGLYYLEQGIRDPHLKGAEEIGEALMRSAQLGVSMQSLALNRDVILYERCAPDRLALALQGYLGNSQTIKAIRQGKDYGGLTDAVGNCADIPEIAQQAAASPQAYEQLREMVASDKLASYAKVTTKTVKAQEPDGGAYMFNDGPGETVRKTLSVDQGKLPFMKAKQAPSL